MPGDFHKEREMKKDSNIDYRVRIYKNFEDGSHFSIEAVGKPYELDSVLETVFESLRSFNVEIEKQKEK